MMYIRRQETGCHGFTLIETMVAMVIALVLLAGVVGIFISQQRSANMVLDKTDRLSDLFLASQIMQSKLRDAKAICWDSTNKQIVYQPLDSAVKVIGPCTTVDDKNGAFKLVSAGASGCGTSSTPCICWKRPDPDPPKLPHYKCQELVRNLKDATGMQISPVSNTDPKVLRRITLTALSQKLHRVDQKTLKRAYQDVSLEFDVWPRN